MNHPFLNLKKYSNQVVVVNFKIEELNTEDIALSISNELTRLTKKNMAMNIVLNLANINMIASPILGQLTQLIKLTAESGGKIVLCQASQKIKDILEITRLDTYLIVFSSLDEALIYFETPAN